MIQFQGKDRIAGINDGEIGRGVGLGAGVRLDVGMIGIEQTRGALKGKLFNHVHIDTATVVAFTGIALGIFVGQHQPIAANTDGLT